MATRIIKTAGQVAFEGLQGELKTPMPWDNCSIKAAWEAFAAKHNIQPLTEEVPEPPTDGALLVKAYDTKCDEGTNAVAAEFLRLRAERIGEPLPVTGQYLHDRWHTDCVHEDSPWDSLADKINQHRGVRPVPQVTAEMVRATLDAFYACNKGGAESLAHAADYLNAELAKAAVVQPVTPMKVAAYVLSNGVLHTFDDDTDMVAFTKSHAWGSAARVDGHEHHPRKDGGA